MARLHDGHSGRERFQQVQALRLRVRARHGQHVEALQEGDLLRPVHRPVAAELALEAHGRERLRDAVEVGAVLGREVPGGLEPRRLKPQLAPHADVGRGEQVQALLGRDPRHVADREGAARLPMRQGLETVEADPDRRRLDLAARQLEIAGHELRVVVARRDEAGDGRLVGGNQLLRLLPVGRRQPFDEQVLARERAHDRAAELAHERRRERDEQGRRQHHDVEGRLLFQVAQQLLELLGLVARFAPQHRDRHVAQELGVDRDAAAGRRADHRRRVPDEVEDRRRLAEEREVLLEVDADPGEENVRVGDVLLVDARRSVDRQQHHVVAARHELRGERVVAQARAAVHPPGSGGDREDAQGLQATPARPRSARLT